MLCLAVTRPDHGVRAWVLRCAARQVRLGPSGVEEIMPIGDIIPYEANLVEEMKAELKDSISKGKDFVLNN